MILAKRFFTADDTYLRCNLHDSHCRFHWIVKSLFHGLVRIVLVNQKIEHLRHICWDSTKVSAFVLLFCGNKVSTIYNNMCKLLYCCVSFPMEVSLFLLLPAVHVWSIICVKVWVRLTFDQTDQRQSYWRYPLASLVLKNLMFYSTECLMN